MNDVMTPEGWDDVPTCSADGCNSPLGAPGDRDGLCSWCNEALDPPPVALDVPRLLAHIGALESWALGATFGTTRSTHYATPSTPTGHVSHHMTATLRGHLVFPDGYRTVRSYGRSYADALAGLIPQLARLEREDAEEVADAE